MTVTRQQRERDHGGTLPRQCQALVDRGRLVAFRCEQRAVTGGRGFCAAHRAEDKAIRVKRREIAAAQVAALALDEGADGRPRPTLDARTRRGLTPPLPLPKRKRRMDDDLALYTIHGLRLLKRRAA